METIPQSTSQPQGGVYLVRMEGTDYYKIGISSGEIENRIAQLQTASPFRLQLVAWRVQENPLEVEQAIHRALKPWHMRGEWFSCEETAIYCVFDDFNNMARIDALLSEKPMDAFDEGEDGIPVDVATTNASVLDEMTVDGDMARRVQRILLKNPTASQRYIQMEVFGYTGGHAHDVISAIVKRMRSV